MYYLCDKYGFISGFVIGEDREGEQVLKAKHCLDIREAKPYKTQYAAESAYKKSHSSDWWHAVVNTLPEIKGCPDPFKQLLLDAADALDGEAGDHPVATRIYNAIGE